MTTKILCPVDGTPHAIHALVSAAEMAGKFGAELSVCVVNIAHGGGRGPLIHHWSDAEAQQILDAAEARSCKLVNDLISDFSHLSGIVCTNSAMAGSSNFASSSVLGSFSDIFSSACLPIISNLSSGLARPGL